ncbi:hypothetical protein GA0070617_2073 [Micromonospora yangpuensis]|uniref:Uncharacterized protein n=1 Tax=Micromonospora yangpuensis TaxID=683228 RepID=A0A1C6UEM4_9ACTN|nr:hypothetical protein GA0070617_2073 [Micromonospora yangpuensis]
MRLRLMPSTLIDSVGLIWLGRTAVDPAISAQPSRSRLAPSMGSGGARVGGARVEVVYPQQAALPTGERPVAVHPVLHALVVLGGDRGTGRVYTRCCGLWSSSAETVAPAASTPGAAGSGRPRRRPWHGRVDARHGPQRPGHRVRQAERLGQVRHRHRQVDDVAHRLRACAGVDRLGWVVMAGSNGIGPHHFSPTESIKPRPARSCGCPPATASWYPGGVRDVEVRVVGQGGDGGPAGVADAT